MTAAEFLHPLKKAGRRDQVQAALYFLKHYQGRGAVRGSEIRDLLVLSRIPGAKGMNVSRDLANSIPFVHQPSDSGSWAITGRGEERVRGLLGLRGRLSDSPDPEADAAILQRLARASTDDATREYIEEAVKCLRVDARRAAVVFLWSGAVSVIREEVWRHGAKAIEATLQSHNPKARFRKKGDFSTVKDADLLQATQDLGVYDKSEKKRLGEALDLRNDCGHPVKYKPGEKKVSSFIEDVVGIVFA